MAQRQWDVVYMPSCLIKIIIFLSTYTRLSKFECLLQNMKHSLFEYLFQNMEPLTRQLKWEAPDICAACTYQEQTHFSCITNPAHVTTWKALSYISQFHGYVSTLNRLHIEHAICRIYYNIFTNTYVSAYIRVGRLFAFKH
jgi:hypothetical protein